MEKELINTIIDTNHSIIVGLDYNNICRLFSKGAEIATSYKRSEVIGKKWNEIFLSFEDQAKLDKLWKAAWEIDYEKFSDTINKSAEIYESWEAISKKEVFNAIGPLQIRSGEIRTIFWQNTKVYQNENIKKQLLISVGIDITEQKKYEKDILKQNRDFENLNEELKQINDELINAKEKAEEANRLKTEFLNNMSHEIRTPLNGILGFSEMVSKSGISEEKRKFYSEIIQKSSHQLLRIIDDILDISFLETKQITLRETVFNLNDLLMHLYSVFHLKSKEKNISLQVKNALADEQSYIISDKTKLNKILSNLIENAIKFTNCGSIEYGYYVEKQKLAIFVKDTGIGISPKYQQIIFERFRKENKEISSKYGGLGLGLSISKENLRLLGGDISVKSQKGEGSTFLITIPYKAARELKNDPSQRNSATFRSNDDYTILIAEDEEVNYLFLKTIFEEEINGKYRLIHAKNGKDAVDLCKGNKNIDLVLMDIKMPVMNGLEATKNIKSILPDLPIIAQTAYSSQSDKEIALKHGCDSFLSKPIKKEKLAGIIHKYLNDK